MDGPASYGHIFRSLIVSLMYYIYRNTGVIHMLSDTITFVLHVMCVALIVLARHT